MGPQQSLPKDWETYWLSFKAVALTKAKLVSDLQASMLTIRDFCTLFRSAGLNPWTLCSLQCSPVHGVFQARILEWAAIPFSRGIFLTQGSNPCLLNCKQILYQQSHQAFSYMTTIQWSNQEIDTILSSKLQWNSNYNNDWAVVVIWGEWQRLFGMRDWSPTLEDWLA